MANREHINILKQGVDVWNNWRKDNPDIKPSLSGVDLRRANLNEADLSGADLRGARLSGARTMRAHLSKAPRGKVNRKWTSLREANLSSSNLRGAHLRSVDLSGANLSGAKLWGADLSRANLSRTDLSSADLREAELRDAELIGADLRDAELIGANLIRSNLNNAILINCSIYGISAWGVQLEGATQRNLVITEPDQPKITLDNLKVAQFIYLLLNNAEVREVIDTITSKVVLILGRFTPERKAILDTIRDELRKHNYTPVLFDFEKPVNRDITETVSTLAHMARFVIADITRAKSIPQELERIVPDLPSVPVQPLLQARAKEYEMFEHFKTYPWVLPIYRYSNTDMLFKSLQEHVIVPAERKAYELTKQ